MPRKALILSMSVNVLFILFFIGKRIYWAYYKADSPHTYSIAAYMKATAEIQESLPIDTGDIVFVGNSLTSNFPVTEMFAGLKYKNRGVSNNKLCDIENRLPSILNAHPHTIIFEAGVNDILDHRQVEDVFKHYTRLTDIIQRGGSKLIIQSTLPVSIKNIQPSIDSLNALLKIYCADNNIPCVDIDKVLRSGTGLDSNLTWDGIHLNIEGYRRWKKELQKVL